MSTTPDLYWSIVHRLELTAGFMDLIVVGQKPLCPTPRQCLHRNFQRMMDSQKWTLDFSTPGFSAMACQELARARRAALLQSRVLVPTMGCDAAEKTTNHGCPATSARLLRCVRLIDPLQGRWSP